MLTINPPCFIYLTMPDDIRNAKLTNDSNGMIMLDSSNATVIAGLINAARKVGESKPRNYFNSTKGGNLSSYTATELYELIKLIASSNSTRTPDSNIRILADYIFNNMASFLKRLNSGDYTLVDDLANLKGLTRREKSLASKICRYLEEWIYTTDNFAINDSVIRATLPYYLMEYGLDYNVNLEKMSYVQFMKVFNELKAAVQTKEPTITGHMIDNIIWYTYRVDTVRTTIANAIVEASIAAKKPLSLNCLCTKRTVSGFPTENIIF